MRVVPGVNCDVIQPGGIAARRRAGILGVGPREGVLPGGNAIERLLPRCLAGPLAEDTPSISKVNRPLPEAEDTFRQKESSPAASVSVTLSVLLLDGPIAPDSAA